MRKFPIECKVICNLVDSQGAESYHELTAVLDFGACRLTREDLWISILGGPTGYETGKAKDLLEGSEMGDEWLAYDGGVGTYRKMYVSMNQMIHDFRPAVKRFYNLKDHEL